MDVLLVAALAGLRAAAIYAVAGRFVVLGQFANQGISQAVQPRLAEALAVGDRAGGQPRSTSTATGWLVLLTWPLLPAGDRVRPGLPRAVRRPSYATARPSCVVLAGAMLVATGCGMVDMVLSMAGRTSLEPGERRCSRSASRSAWTSR